MRREKYSLTKSDKDKNQVSFRKSTSPSICKKSEQLQIQKVVKEVKEHLKDFKSSDYLKKD